MRSALLGIMAVLVALAGTTFGPAAAAPLRGDLGLEVTPPGAVRGRAFRIFVTAAVTAAPPFAGAEISILATAPAGGITGAQLTILSADSLEIRGLVSAAAHATQRIDLSFTRGEARRLETIYLRTVDPDWNPAWRPTAVAPPDTMVPRDRPVVILDATGSAHPAGFSALHFRWRIDHGAHVIKGEPVTSARLDPGEHVVVLVAEDAFGWTSCDTMRIRVE